jgi:hypothetical protein
MFCPLSLLLVRAIQDNAFLEEYGFNTLEDLLSRPKLPEGADQIPLKWRNGVKMDKVFKMTYATYLTHFLKVVQAAGYRGHIRLYAIRVGVGNTLDGMVKSLLRN